MQTSARCSAEWVLFVADEMVVDRGGDPGPEAGGGFGFEALLGGFVELREKVEPGALFNFIHADDTFSNTGVGRGILGN